MSYRLDAITLFLFVYANKPTHGMTVHMKVTEKWGEIIAGIADSDVAKVCLAFAWSERYIMKEKVINDRLTIHLYNGDDWVARMERVK